VKLPARPHRHAKRRARRPTRCPRTRRPSSSSVGWPRYAPSILWPHTAGRRTPEDIIREMRHLQPFVEKAPRLRETRVVARCVSHSNERRHDLHEVWRTLAHGGLRSLPSEGTKHSQWCAGPGPAASASSPPRGLPPISRYPQRISQPRTLTRSGNSDRPSLHVC
jgi:hypothetical protein